MTSYLDDLRRYRLDDRIAIGGMGEVWAGFDTVLNRPVAIKLLKAEYADDPLFVSRFRSEATNAGRLQHPGIAAVYDFGAAPPVPGTSAPRPFLVMELVEGQPLNALLRRREPMDPAVVADLMAQVAAAVGAAHEAGIVHRDLKPANLLVTPDRRVKVTDFGIARAADGIAHTEAGAVVGTPQYLSPEQAQGETAGPASDVYGIGVVAFECLTGRRPFDADSAVATAIAHVQKPVPELPASVPASLRAVVHRALAKDPTERYADGAALALALRNAARTLNDPAPAEPTTQVIAAPQATQVVPAAPVEPLPPAAEPDPEPDPAAPWMAIAATVLVLVLLGLLAWWVIATEEPTHQPQQNPTATRTAVPTRVPDTPTTPASVDIDEGDYTGRDIDDVAAELRQLGVRVQRKELTNDGTHAEGEVDSVNPSGTLQKSELVTVSFYGAKPTPTPTDPPTTAAPQPTPTPTPQPSPASQPTPPPSPAPQAPTTPPPTNSTETAVSIPTEAPAP